MVKDLFSPTILLALALMVVIAMMILPMPAIVLDLGLALSFSLAVLIFTTTLFIERPLDFSSFPTVLLAALVLRLSLNVSSTKLIIGEGHTGTDAAGNVIEAFAEFVMNGNLFLGLVVFCVLLIVNFMVITKGATRMAEVGARFALDGMPGKQLAIDSDMSAGAITHEQARLRRETEQAETSFFGSLDGASKFVRGDAIAGLLITLLNLVVGCMIGVAVHGMGFSDAFETYAILTVGDGLVSQIPAVIISIAAALLLSRGNNTGTADETIFAQFGQHPTALMAVGVCMLFFAVMPGLPFFPFLVGALCIGGAGFWIHHNKKNEVAANAEVLDPGPVQHETTIADTLELDDIHIEFATDLVKTVLDPGIGLDGRITNMRKHIASEFGLILPEIRLTDRPSLEAGEYVIKLFGVEHAKAGLRVGRVLAIPNADTSEDFSVGQATTEPVYGAPARWVEPIEQERAAMAGATIVTTTEVLATHLMEVIKQNLSRLLTLKSLRRILSEMGQVTDPARAEANRKLLDEMIPDRVPLDLLHQVLRLLLEEQVSIRNLSLILEATAEARLVTTQPEGICELVRQRLGFQLVANHKRSDGVLPLIQLAPEWEDVFSGYQIDANHGLDVALPPDRFNQLTDGIANEVNSARESGEAPVLLTSARRRRLLRTVLRAKSVPVPVLSFEEIGVDARLSLVSVVPA